MEVIEDLVKNVNWPLISLDGMLDFILSESKLLLNSQELQKIVIGEFSRRFKEEYVNEETGTGSGSGNTHNTYNNNSVIRSTSSPRKKQSNNSNMGNSMGNMTNMLGNIATNKQNYSFTSDLIVKLISKL